MQWEKAFKGSNLIDPKDFHNTTKSLIFLELAHELSVKYISNQNST